MSKADLARALDIEQSGVSSLEAESSWPTTKNLDRVLTVLGATAYDLAAALDAVNGRNRKNDYHEIREGSPADPLDSLLSDFNARLSALVQEVKRRSPKG